MTAVKRIKGDPLTRYQVDANGCWIWQGARHSAGYGVLQGPNNKLAYAHRFFYEHHAGPIPEGLTIDHLCRVHACVNPAHLEPVTMVVNAQRGNGIWNGRCKRGHVFEGENVYTHPKTGGRSCKECRRAAVRSYYHRTKKAGLAAVLGGLVLCTSASASYNHISACKESLRGTPGDDDVHLWGVATGAKSFGGWGGSGHYADNSAYVWGYFNFSYNYTVLYRGRCSGGDGVSDWFDGS